jgi:asparagine synthase (glutamine-hydrolysing)
MCGINGFVASGLETQQITQVISQMNNLIIHRGPDDDGLHTDERENYSVAMAMRRLAIIDLNTGKQPIFSDNDNLVIFFNGEIYNYKELRNQLLKDGCEFKTASDTEVILKLYEKYNADAFSMLDGMFAFSIYDKRLKKIFIARDFFGEKPLYYYHSENRFYWASELKSITGVLSVHPDISKEALNLFFQLTYIPAPYSIYEGVFKLKPNHYIEFDCAGFSYTIKEISQKVDKTQNNISKMEAVKSVHDMVWESVASRSVSDVPVATFLSGGIDSSIVSLCLAQLSSSKIDTFSMGFKKKSFDETDKSKVVAGLINSNHHEFIVDDNDVKENIDSIILNFDEPFADSSALPSFLVAQYAHQQVKVVLTGDGGDEVFGGYNKYYIGRLNNFYTSKIPSGLHSFLLKVSAPLLSTKDDQRGRRFQANKLMRSINYGNDFYYNIISLGFNSEDRTQLLKNGYFVSDPLSVYKAGLESKTLNDFRNIDRWISLEGDMLVKVDRTSMLTSLESRSPFLNKKIWNYTDQLPEDFLIHGWDKKHILKEAFKSYFSKGFLDKPKKGFGVPVGDWLRGSIKNELLSYIEPDFLKRQGIFNYEWTIKLVNDHVEGKIDNTFKVWTFFCFQKWYKKQYMSSQN